MTNLNERELVPDLFWKKTESSVKDFPDQLVPKVKGKLCMRKAWEAALKLQSLKIA